MRTIIRDSLLGGNMDALRGRWRVKYSRSNARIEIPFHVLERLIARDLKLQEIEFAQEKQEQTSNDGDAPRLEIFYGSPDRYYHTTLTEEKSSSNYIPRSQRGYVPSGLLVYVNNKVYSVSFTESPD